MPCHGLPFFTLSVFFKMTNKTNIMIMSKKNKEGQWPLIVNWQSLPGNFVTWQRVAWKLLHVNLTLASCRYSKHLTWVSEMV